MKTLEGFRDKRKPFLDYAALKVDTCKDEEGNRISRSDSRWGSGGRTLKLAAMPPECPQGRNWPCLMAKLIGYPGGNDYQPKNTQWEGTGEVEPWKHQRLMRYWIYSSPGDSGGPLLMDSLPGCAQNCVVGMPVLLDRDPQTLQETYVANKVNNKVIGRYQKWMDSG